MEAIICRAPMLKRGPSTVIDIPQYTSGMPIHFEFYDVTLPDDATAQVYVQKDTTEIFNACVINNNIVSFDTTTQMLAETGRKDAQIMIQSKAIVLYSFTFAFNIEKSIVNSTAIESTNEFSALQQAMREISAVYYFAGSIMAASLPELGEKVGQTFNLTDKSNYGPAGTNVAWTGKEWDALSGITPVDSVLSLDSSNPIQNKAVAAAINQINTGLSDKISGFGSLQEISLPYTAPVDGIFVVLMTAKSGDCDGYVYVNVACANQSYYIRLLASKGYSTTNSIPVKKGSAIYIHGSDYTEAIKYLFFPFG